MGVGVGWQSGFDEHYSYNPDNCFEDSVTEGVIFSIVPEPMRRFSSDDPVEFMDHFTSSSSSDTEWR